jgi:small-conductance mechanosensitive channel
MHQLLTKFLKPRSWVAKLLLVLLGGAFLYLGYHGYLDPIRQFLNQDHLAFKIGEMRFSLYLILKSTVLIIIFFWIVSIVSDFGEQRINNIRGIRASNKALIVKAFQIFLYFIAFLVSLNFLGIDLTAFAVFGGALGIGIGFGLQKIASNFISGIILLFEKSIEKDDMVELTDGTFGTIKKNQRSLHLV